MKTTDNKKQQSRPGSGRLVRRFHRLRRFYYDAARSICRW